MGLQLVRTRFWPRGEFFRNFAIALSSSVAARIVFLLGLPLIARFFSPEHVGQWQMFLTFTMVLPSFISCRFEVAVVLPDEDEEAMDVLRLCVWTSLVTSCLCLVPFIVLSKPIAQLIGAPDLWPYLISIPLVTFAIGVEQACNYWLIRTKAFAQLAPPRILRALSIVAVPLVLVALTDVDVGHLIAGSVLGQLLGAAIVAASVARSRRIGIRRKTSWRRMYQTAVKYKNYPMFVAPYSLVGQLGKRLVYVFLAIFASSHTVGLYAMAMQLTFIPIAFISTPLNQVFYPKIVGELSEGHLGHFVSRVLSGMVIFAAPPSVFFVFYASDILGFILGERWSAAGPFAAVWTAPAFMLLLTSWLDRIFDALNRQRLAVAMQVVYDVFSISLLFVMLQLGVSPFLAVATYCLTTAVYNGIWLAITFRLAGFSLVSLSRIGLLLGGLVGGTAMVCWGANFLWEDPKAMVTAALAVLALQVLAVWKWRKT